MKEDAITEEEHGTGKAYIVVVTDDRTGGAPPSFAGTRPACSSEIRTFTRKNGIVRAIVTICPLEGLRRRKVDTDERADDGVRVPADDLFGRLHGRMNGGRRGVRHNRPEK